MKKMKRLLACVTALVMALALFTGCGGGTQSTPPASNPPASSTPEEKPNENAADLVLTNGTIQTMVSEDDVAEAVAVKDGEIVFVGTSADAEAYIGDATQVIDLAGRYVTPGFIDSHNHYPGPYLTMETELDLMALGADLEAYKTALTEFVAEHPDFEIYIVSSMDLKAFPDSKPSNDWLDEICSDKPIKVIDVSTHGWLLNSKAIEMVGLTKDTPDPAGGTIYKDANGELTGYFSDCDDIITGLPSFEYTAEQYKAAFRAFQAEANSYGITSLNAAGADQDGLKDIIQLEGAVEMEKDGELYLRINHNFFTYPPLDAQDVISYLDANQGANSEFINVRQVKFTLDGVPEGKSSYLLEPYAETAGTAPDYVSSATVTEEEMTAFATAVNAAGYTVQLHCMGDASVRLGLNAFEASAEANGNPDVRNAITHVNLITDEDKVRMGELGVIAHMQPMWFYYDPFFSPLEEQMLGPERFDSEYHIKDMLDAGIIITGSQDYPVTYDFAPLHAIEAGATQCSPYPGEDQDVETYTRNADQAVSVYEMLKMYTTNGAYAAFLDDRVGTIEVGKKADLVVLGDNLLTCDVKHISDVEVVYTISDGRIVYENA